MITTKHLLIGTVIASSLALVNCNKSAEQERREAEKAATKAEKETSKATTEASEKSGEAKEKASRESQEYLTTVTREQADYRTKINENISDIDKRLGELKVDMTKAKDGMPTYDKTSKSAPEIQRLLNRRQTLKNDLDEMGKTDPHDWPALKNRIDRDLSEEGMRGPRPGT
jgi:hypothetical protein